jgi:hypothetical protein
MYQLTAHKDDRYTLMQSGGNEPIRFQPVVRIKYKSTEATLDLNKHTSCIIEMIHWLLNQNYVFNWDSPSNDTFNFYFSDDEAAIHFLLSHQ